MVGGAGRGRRSDDRDSGGLEIIMLVVSLLAIVLAPSSNLGTLAISRQREFLADASSVELTRNPQGMINALRKLEHSQPMSRHKCG